MTMSETDTIEPAELAAEIAQSAMFGDEEIARTAPVYLPGFEGLGRLTGQPVFDDNEVIDAAVSYYRAKGFPYRQLPLHACMQQINQLAQTADENLTGTVVGYSVADTYHPHRFAAAATDKRSPLDSFNSDKYLRMTIEKTLAHGAVGEEFLGMMALVAGTQACSNFRPGFALSYYRRYYQPGWTVLDTSTGYGGRLVGFLATNTRGTYIGIDPNVPTHEGNVRMMRDLGAPKGYRALLINLPVEDVDVDNPLQKAEWVAPMTDVHAAGGKPFITTLREMCDFAFTSPPYFAKERYSFDDTQSWVRYGDNAEHWRTGFLVPMMRLQLAALKPGAYSCVNVADVVVGKMTVPLSEWTMQAATEVGFEYVSTDRYRLQRRMGKGAANGSVAYEPVHIFRKPGHRVQIVSEGPVTTTELANSMRQPEADTLCASPGCGHKFIKHDDVDAACLIKTCMCENFEVPWCSECGADEGADHNPSCPLLIRATPEMLNEQLAYDANLVIRPIGDHVLCSVGQCGHPLSKHDDGEGECLKKQCLCERFEFHCSDCGRREGEIHAPGCASATQGHVFDDSVSIATLDSESRQNAAVGSSELSRAEAALSRAQPTPVPAQPEWKNCPIEGCTRKTRHVPGSDCAVQSTMNTGPVRRPAAPPPVEPDTTRVGTKEYRMYGPITEHCPERVRDSGGKRALMIACAGCGAPAGHWCNRD